MDLLEEVRALRTTQPLETFFDDGVNLVYWLRVTTDAPLKLTCRLGPGNESWAITMAEDPRIGWSLDTTTWSSVAAGLWNITDRGPRPLLGARGPALNDYWMALTEFRNHLDSLGWVVRLLAELHRGEQRP